jgi:VCBS repeat-containing protein
MKSIPAYTIAGITRPELFLDFDGNIILTPAALAFADQYGLKALYLGCPPGTPFPPVPGFIMTTPVDTNTADNIVAENAAANTTVGITAEAHDIVHFPITYSLTADSSGGGFQINATTGVVTVANPNQINYEASASHSYNITVRATDGIFATTQTFTINVSNVNEAPTGTSKTVATTEDHGYAFTIADFGFSDPDIYSANTLQAVKITTLPAGGTLTNNGNPVAAGAFISAADIAAGHLVFTPTTNSNGSPLASFTFQVQDNGGTANGGHDLDPSAKTMTINVAAVNDAPSFTVGADQTCRASMRPTTSPIRWPLTRMATPLSACRPMTMAAPPMAASIPRPRRPSTSRSPPSTTRRASTSGLTSRRSRIPGRIPSMVLSATSPTARTRPARR